MSWLGLYVCMYVHYMQARTCAAKGLDCWKRREDGEAEEMTEVMYSVHR